MIPAFLTNFLYDVPYIIFSLAGIIYSFCTWRAHRKLSTIMVAVLSIVILRMLAFDLLAPIIYNMLGRGYDGPYSSSFLRVSWVLLGALTYGALVFCAFYGFQEASEAKRASSDER